MRRFACLWCVLQAMSAAGVVSQAPQTLDRSAFTFTDYRLIASLDIGKHALAVEGDVVLRNDSDRAQSAASLQISSSLQWKEIAMAGEAVPRAGQKLLSDVDHTGYVSEALVNLPPVPPHGSITLHVAYGGAIELDATRLRRLGTPQNTAERSDWDRIGSDITALRGVGYVQWYPVSIETVMLSDRNLLFEDVARWKARHQESRMTLTVRGISGGAQLVSSAGEQTAAADAYELRWQRFGMHTPVILVAGYERWNTANGDVFSLKPASVAAQRYAAVFGALRPLGRDLKPIHPVTLVQLPSSFSPFEADHLFMTPFAETAKEPELKSSLMHLAAHAYFYSKRAWLDEGFAHWTQLAAVRQDSGRKAVLDLLKEREAALALADSGEPADAQPLVTAYDELFYRTKAAFVCWMLSDMLGEEKLVESVRAYSSERDREPAYFQRLLERISRRDLESFFDDWVYRDRGLPEFKITNVYTRQNLNGGLMMTVSIENSGTAGADVSVAVRAKDLENSTRVWVAAKSKASARVLLPLQPTEVTVNDGSVPEIDPTDNVYTVPSAR